MRLHRAVRFLAFGFLVLIIPAAFSSPSPAQIAVGLSVRIGPPALPIYEQALGPGPGYLWTPGYWGWGDDDGYYWVPGTWVMAPVGMLWTPGYWGWGGGFYAWHPGYWGPHVGFYGGINYGFGYGGVGFVGGEWRGGAFFYNTAVMRVDTVHVTNVYVNRTVVVNNESRVAFNGGEGGVAVRPTAAEEAASREPHQAPLAAQTEHEHAASQNRALFASENHGAPAVAATTRPGEFSGHNVVAAKAAGAPYRAPAVSPREARVPAPEANRPSAADRPSTAPSHSESEPRPENARPMDTRPTDARPTNDTRPQNESHPGNAPKAKPGKQPKEGKHPANEEKHEKGR